MLRDFLMSCSKVTNTHITKKGSDLVCSHMTKGHPAVKLVLADCSRDFENWDTNSPRSDKYPSVSGTSHSYQCGNSWFFSNDRRRRRHELDMKNKRWCEVGEFDPIYWSATGLQSIVSDGEGKAYWFGGSEGLFDSPITDVLEAELLTEDREWSVLRPTIPFTSIVGDEALQGSGGEHPGLEYCASMELVGESSASGMKCSIDDPDVKHNDGGGAYNGGPCLLAFGGYDTGDGIYFNGLYRFDIQSKSWSKLDSVVKPSGRSHSTLIHLASQQKLLMYGGRGARNATFDDLWTFDLSKQKKGWQRVTATGAAPNCSNTTVVVFKGSKPKILVLREDPTTKEILLYFLDCLTLHWTVFNSHIRMELNFASIFQPKESEVVDGIHFFLYLAASQGEARIYFVSLKSNNMPLKLYETSLHRHLCDITIECQPE